MTLDIRLDINLWYAFPLHLDTGDAEFIHQLAADAYTAQHVGENVSTISAAFAYGLGYDSSLVSQVEAGDCLKRIVMIYLLS